jgi:nucleotide-binding universal stress UspA family protein
MGAASAKQIEGTAGRRQAMPRRQEARRRRHRYQARVLVGPVAETIVKHAADKRCDIIYIGTRGMSALGKALIGSTATKILHISHAPVLLVK